MRGNGACVVAKLAGLVLTLASVAARADVTVSATPAALDLCPGGNAAGAWVVVRNGGTQPVRDVCINALANGPITWRFSQATANARCDVVVAALPAGGSASAVLTVQLTSTPPSNPALHLRAAYLGNDANKGTVAGIAVGTLEVKPVAPASVEGLKAEVRIEVASMHEEEKARALLVLTNATTVPLKLGPLVFRDAANTTLSIAEGAKVPDTLAPNSSAVIALALAAAKDITPGKRSGVVEVEALGACGAVLRRAVPYEVTLGVFGQSDLMTLVGVPALLFLPGFLVFSVWILLWSLGMRVRFLAKRGGDEFVLSLKSAEFWVLAITLSLVAFWIAPSTRLGYTEAYQLRDIARLWWASLIFGVLTYGAMYGIDRLRKAQEERRAKEAADAADRKSAAEAEEEARRTPTDHDSVTQLLERMVRRQWPLNQSKPVDGGFRLWPGKGGTSWWVISPIEWRRTAEQAEQADPAGAQTAEQLLGEIGKIQTAGAGTVAWADGVGPRELSDSAITPSATDRALVKLTTVDD